jgi:hypothetical protein
MPTRRGGCTWTSHSLPGGPAAIRIAITVLELAKQGMREHVVKKQEAPKSLGELS